MDASSLGAGTPKAAGVAEPTSAAPGPSAERGKARARDGEKAARKKGKRRVAAAAPEADPEPIDIEAQLAQAAQLIRAGYTRQAVRMAHAILKADPKQGRAFRLLGIGYTLMQNNRLACESYRRYLQLTPTASDRAKVEELLQACSGA
jgi:Flp pilus assembly protein TadD